MDISRRSFLKLTLGGLLATAIDTNPILSTISDAISHSPYKVFLYLIQTKDGKWKVKGTTCTNINKVEISPTKFNVDTFKPLGVYDSDVANDKKLEFWNKYECGKGFQKINYQIRINNGNKAKSTGQLDSIRKKAGQSTMNYINSIHKENNHWRKLGDSKIGKKRTQETKNKIQLGTSHSWRPVLQFSKNGEFVKEWPNFVSIKEELGFNHTNICACCQNRPKYKSAYGFVWKYKENL